MGKKVWVYESGDIFKTFDSADEANAWFEIHDPEGVAFEEERGELQPAGSADRNGVPKAPE